MEELKLIGNHLNGSRPLLSFSANFDKDPRWKLLKEMIMQVGLMPKAKSILTMVICPLCSKSVSDMSKVWERYDMEIAATPMPEHYRDKMVTLPQLCFPSSKKQS